MRRISDSSFLLAANGNPDSPPASGVRDYLAASAGHLVTVFHPLNPEDPPVHRIAEWRNGRQVREASVRLPSNPPATFAVDAFVPLRRGRCDAWLAFSNLSALHGIARRAVRRVGAVAYWAVDFVPDRFGAGSPLTRVYDSVDRFAATHSDLRIELTAAARDARSDRLGLEGNAAPTHVAPVGVWVERLEHTSEDAWSAKRVVFVGHLVARQGVSTLIRAVALLPDVRLEIAGRGPEEDGLRALAAELGVSERVVFHGFLSSHLDVERLVASATVAAAPYATDVDSFTRFADPSKLRSYTGAGLPIVLTDVPPNARELVQKAGAELVEDTPEGVAKGITAVLATEDDWKRRRKAALAYSEGFDWSRIVPSALERLGFSER